MVEAKSHQQRQIEDVFAGDEKPNDHSLAAKSWQRALKHEKPKTMAPDEWQAYFDATGEQPQNRANQRSLVMRGWQSLKRWLGVPEAERKSSFPSPKNCARFEAEDSEF